MTFQLANLAFLFILLIAATSVLVGIFGFLVASAVRVHRPIRLAQHQSIASYYGSLAHSH